MPKIEIYSADYCPYCTKAKALLKSKDADFITYDVADDTLLRQESLARSGKTSVPQIFIDGKYIGGCDDLYALDSANELDSLLKG